MVATQALYDEGPSCVIRVAKLSDWLARAARRWKLGRAAIREGGRFVELWHAVGTGRAGWERLDAEGWRTSVVDAAISWMVS